VTTPTKASTYLPMSEKRVQPNCGLIQNEQFWGVHQSCGKGDSPLLTATMKVRTI